MPLSPFTVTKIAATPGGQNNLLSLIENEQALNDALYHGQHFNLRDIVRLLRNHNGHNPLESLLQNMPTLQSTYFRGSKRLNKKDLLTLAAKDKLHVAARITKSVSGGLLRMPKETFLNDIFYKT